MIVWKSGDMAKWFAEVFREVSSADGISIDVKENVTVASYGETSRLRRVADWLRDESAWAFYGVPLEAPRRSDADGSAKATSQKFALPSDSDCILVPVWVSGIQRLFCLDTGANSHFFDSSLAWALGEPLGVADVEMSSGPAAVSVYHAPLAWVGELPLASKVPVACTSFKVPQEVLGVPIMGIVGMPFLWGKIVVVDFDSRLVAITSEDNANSFSDWEVLPTHVESGCPFVTIRMPDGTEEKFLVDSGSGGWLDVNQAVFDRLVACGALRVSGMEVVSIGLLGSHGGRRGLLQKCGLGRLEEQDVVVTEGKNNIIGMGILTKFNVAIDWQKHRILLKKRSQGRNWCQLDMVGQSVRRRGNLIWIHNADPEGHAWQSGLREADSVLEVQGRPATDFRLSQLQLLMCGVSQVDVTFRVRRGPSIAVVTVRK
jgi:hypothetical protein